MFLRLNCYALAPLAVSTSPLRALHVCFAEETCCLSCCYGHSSCERCRVVHGSDKLPRAAQRASLLLNDMRVDKAVKVSLDRSLHIFHAQMWASSSIRVRAVNEPV